MHALYVKDAYLYMEYLYMLCNIYIYILHRYTCAYKNKLIALPIQISLLYIDHLFLAVEVTTLHRSLVFSR